MADWDFIALGFTIGTIDCKQHFQGFVCLQLTGCEDTHWCIKPLHNPEPETWNYGAADW